MRITVESTFSPWVKIVKSQNTQTKDSKKKKTPRHPFASIKNDLEGQKAALLAEAGVLIGAGLNPRSEALPDIGDQASAEANQNFTLRLREREQKLLKKITDAISRITDGSYGVCDSCGEKISKKRLKARPVTTLCIECKTQEEEQENTRQ